MITLFIYLYKIKSQLLILIVFAIRSIELPNVATNPSFYTNTKYAIIKQLLEKQLLPTMYCYIRKMETV